MDRRAIIAITALLLTTCLLPTVAIGGQPPPWAAQQDPHRRHMENMADLEASGQLREDQAREVNRYWATHLRRGAMNAIEAAQYSIAEIHLRQGRTKQAIAQLEKVLATAPSEDLKSLTHLNLGEVYRRQVEDAAKASEHYKKVAGPLRHRARAFMVAMLAETGKADQAAQVTEQLIANAKEKGEKLALLQRLAALYERAKLPDKALAVYQRIVADFTQEDIQQMRQAAVREVQETMERMNQLRMEQNWEEAERLGQKLGRRGQELRAAGRRDELTAFQQALNRARRQLFQAGPQPPRPPQPGAPNPPRPPVPGKRREGEF